MYRYLHTYLAIKVTKYRDYKMYRYLKNQRLQLLELYPKHMEIYYPMHTTEIPILTSWSNACYAVIIICKHHDIASSVHTNIILLFNINTGLN